MVPLIPPAFAARDMLLAAGLGFLLALGYRALRCVLGGGRAALFVCDCLAGLAGGVLLRSAAVSRLYAGLPRWYALGAMALAFWAAVRVLAPPFVRLRRLAMLPLGRAAGILLRVLRPIRARQRQKCKESCEKWPRKGKKESKKCKTALQKQARVLYNSSNSPPAGQL